jgi:tetratricopeptide (TPR) repeat protein
LKRTPKLRVIFIFSLLSGMAPIHVQAQTSLPVTVPESLSRLLNNRAEIERCITLASPDCLAQAKAGLAQSKVIPDNDKVILGELIRGVSLILYPAPSPAGTASKQPAAAKNAGTEDSGIFFVDPSLKNIQKADSLCLTQLVEASQGRVFASTDGTAASFLAELLPSLAIFRTKDLNTARAALVYAERFETSSALPSVIPGLVRARYFLLTNDMDKAFSQYISLLAAYPDLWPARLALGMLSLGRNRSIEALNYLSPLAATRKNDSAFLTSYAFALYSNGRFAEAEPFVLAAIDSDPVSADMALAAAHIDIDRNDFAKAGPYLEILGKKRPGDRMYLYLKTVQLNGLSRKDEALKWARKAFQAFPADPEMMVLLADVIVAGPESGRAEACALAEAARKSFAADKEGGAQSNLPAQCPLAASMRAQAEREAVHLLLVEAYRRQDWFQAAALLDAGEMQTLDKTLVATVLRRSGRNVEALDFASKWYASDPGSEPAAKAYLRSLATSGTRLASAEKLGVSDAGPGLLALASAGSSPGMPSGQTGLIGLVLSLLSTSSSPEMQSYLYYLKGTLQVDQDTAVDCYRSALLARADNVEALAALAKTYAAKGDSQKSLFYIKQARMIGVTDKDLDDDLLALEKSLTGK